MAIIVKRSVTGGESDLKAEMLDTFYPIGSYYETSDTNFDPNIAWGGTWLEDTAGRVLVAMDSGTFSTVGATGGSEYIQNHTHDIRFNGQSGNRVLMSYTSGPTAAYDLTWTSVTANTGANVSNLGAGVVKDATGNVTIQTGDSGNLQPYKVVKRWHRTA